MPEPTTPPADPTANPTPPASGNGGTPPITPPSDQPRTFTQAELDAVIADRLSRQQRALDAKAAADKAAAEAARLAEQGEFKTLAETAQRERDELKAALAQRDHTDLQREVAGKHSLPAEMATRLQGTTREELEADAKALAKLITASPPPPVPGNRPGPRPQGGPSGSETNEASLRESGRYAAI